MKQMKREIAHVGNSAKTVNRSSVEAESCSERCTRADGLPDVHRDGSASDHSALIGHWSCDR